MSSPNDALDPDLPAGVLDTDHVLVRSLREADFDAVVAIDAASTGLRREDFFRKRIASSVADSSVHLSLAAELDAHVVGFVAVSLLYGEFGRPEPVAMLDAIGVHPDYRGRHVSSALLRQLEMNLGALRVERLRTEVGWDQQELLGFFASTGFTPALRLCLEKRIS